MHKFKISLKKDMTNNQDKTFFYPSRKNIKLHHLNLH